MIMFFLFSSRFLVLPVLLFLDFVLFFFLVCFSFVSFSTKSIIVSTERWFSVGVLFYLLSELQIFGFYHFMIRFLFLK